MTKRHAQRLDLLILARLATSSRPPSLTKLERDLAPVVAERLSGREWAERCRQRLDALQAAGDIDARRVPTARGLARLHEALGVQTLPRPWPKIRGALLPALALDLPGARWSEVARASELRARVIRQEHDLPLPETPTLAQAVDAQIWQALGLAESGPLTLGKLRRALLERSLGTSLRAKAMDVDEAGRWLATAAVGTTKRDIDSIQRALVSRWIFGDDASPSPSNQPAAASDPPTHSPARARTSSGTNGTAGASRDASSSSSLASWAAEIQAQADRCTTGRYGDERVFIAAVWKATQTGPAARRMSLPEFKERLVEANRAGLLQLHRADLVGAMDSQLVRESETRHLNAAFHFIEIHPRRTS